MPESGYRPPGGFLTMAQAQERLGVSKVTLAKMVREGRLPAYRDERDKRIKLVKPEDVERLTQPTPLPAPAQR